jgi:hypothetical protein
MIHVHARGALPKATVCSPHITYGGMTNHLLDMSNKSSFPHGHNQPRACHQLIFEVHNAIVLCFTPFQAQGGPTDGETIWVA